MLLQSHVRDQHDRFIIDLLPALPKSWSEGSVTGLRARGGVTVDLKWRNGKLESATLTPDQDGPLNIRLAGKINTLKGKAGTPLRVGADF